MYSHIKFLKFLVSCILLACGLAQANPVHSADWPSKAIKIVVPTDPGGSLDRMARIMVPYLSEELGQPVFIENRPGVLTIIGHDYVLRQPPDGYTLVMSIPTPFLLFNIMKGRARFGMEDFQFINNQWGDWTAVIVPQNRPYNSLIELIEVIRVNPGKIRMARAPGSIGDILFDNILREIGIPFDAIKRVTYQSGAPVRIAILGGQLDLAMAAAEGTIPIRDHIRTLAVVRDERVPGWDAPPINEVLEKEYGFTIPIMNEMTRSLGVASEFKKKYPQRWAKLVNANKRILQRKDAIQAFQEARIDTQWIGPEKTAEEIDKVRIFLENYMSEEIQDR